MVVIDKGAYYLQVDASIPQEQTEQTVYLP